MKNMLSTVATASAVAILINLAACDTNSDSSVSMDTVNESTVEMTTMSSQCTMDKKQMAGMSDECTMGDKKMDAMSDECTMGDKKMAGMSDECTMGNKKMAGMSDECTMGDKKMAGMSDECTMGDKKMAGMSDECTMGDKKMAGMSDECTMGDKKRAGMSDECTMGNKKMDAMSDECTMGDKKMAGMSDECTMGNKKMAAKPDGCGMEECDMGDGTSGCDMTTKQEIEQCDKSACPKVVSLMEEALQSWNHYGTAETINRTPIGVDFLDQQKEAPVTVVADISNVCEKKGCWMEIADENGKNSIRVTFKDYAFFVPRNAKGHKAVISGQSKMVTRDVEYLRHIAEDQGKSPEEIAKITEPVQQLEIIADKVYIQGDDLEKPYTP